MMAQIIMSSEAATLAPPSNQEALAINEFMNGKSELAAFSYEVSSSLPLIARDLDAALPTIRGLFTSQSRFLENRMVLDLPDFEPWTPGSLQPRLLARSVSKLPSVGRFVKEAFRASSQVEPAGNSRDAVLRKFLCKMFVDEVKAIRTSELAVSPKQILETMNKVGDHIIHINDLQKHYLSNEGFKLIDIRAPDLFGWGRWAHHIICASPDDEEHIRKLIFKGMDNTDEEMMEFYSINAIAIESVDKVSEYRRIKAEKAINSSLDTFKRLWKDRSNLSFSIPGAAPSGDIYFKELLKSDTIAPQLETDSTSNDLENAELKTSNVVQERLRKLDEFARKNPGKPVSGLTQELFPRLAAALDSATLGEAHLPTSAPAIWQNDKQPGETPPAFVKRVYGEWLGNGFSRATLRHLDPPLAQAMTNWLRHNEMPADVDLPTLKEQNSRWVDRIEREGLNSLLPGGAPEDTLRHASRLLSARHRRQERSTK